MESLGKEVDEILSFCHSFQKCTFENRILTFRAPSGHPPTPLPSWLSLRLLSPTKHRSTQGQGLRFDLEVEARYENEGVQRLGDWACAVGSSRSRKFWA